MKKTLGLLLGLSVIVLLGVTVTGFLDKNAGSLAGNFAAENTTKEGRTEDSVTANDNIALDDEIYIEQETQESETQQQEDESVMIWHQTDDPGIRLENAPESNGRPYYIRVNRQENVVTVYGLDETGHYAIPVKAMVCSVGLNNNTVVGTFTTSDRYAWHMLVGNVYGQYSYRIYQSFMFHSVPYFSENKGDIETLEYNKLGEAASLGCVRLALKDCKWIYDNCPRGTLVTIYDDDNPGPLGKPIPETIDVNSPYAGWDPTDPDPENPWGGAPIRIFGAYDHSIEIGEKCFLFSGVTAYTAQGEDITSSLVATGNLDINKSGDYQITYTATAPNGDTESTTITIKVNDTVPPEIHLLQQKISLNMIEASDSNIKNSILRYVSATDEGRQLTASDIHIETDEMKEKVTGTYSVTIWAEDTAGNESERVRLQVDLDRAAPVIAEPLSREIHVEKEEDIEKALLEQMVVTDEGRGVESTAVSWAKHPGSEVYSVIYFAKDKAGNISNLCLEDFMIYVGN